MDGRMDEYHWRAMGGFSLFSLFPFLSSSSSLFLPFLTAGEGEANDARYRRGKWIGTVHTRRDAGSSDGVEDGAGGEPA
ncbi:hypothetical protein BKA81DRAFT_31953 [Phyllosticta paracitricarpa]|uniref:Uncharacterized protein n=1 Tax=Phyllosticta paracitricarpa TaxID=2016321 RepID=A0ABR1N1W6_9PEZI